MLWSAWWRCNLYTLRGTGFQIHLMPSMAFPSAEQRHGGAWGCLVLLQVEGEAGASPIAQDSEITWTAAPEEPWNTILNPAPTWVITAFKHRQSMNCFHGKQILVIFFKETENLYIFSKPPWSGHRVPLMFCFLMTLKTLLIVPDDECGCKSGLT